MTVHERLKERLRLARERIAELEAKHEALVEHRAVFDNPADAWADSEAWEHRCKELEANNARLREAGVQLIRKCDEIIYEEGGTVDMPDFECFRRALNETPADSLAAVKREACEEMQEKIAQAVKGLSVVNKTGQQRVIDRERVLQTIYAVQLDA